MTDQDPGQVMTIEAAQRIERDKFLDSVFSAQHSRKWNNNWFPGSMRDTTNGGFCESDQQFSARIITSLARIKAQQEGK